jgi:hypothetical protein
MVMQKTRISTWYVALCRFLTIAVSLLFVGCDKPATVITGLVLLDGQPIPNATLEFFPVSGKGRVSFAISDANGRYRVDVSPTKLKVVITATKVDGKQRGTYSGDGLLSDRVVDILPERYGYQEKTPLVAEPVEGKTTTIDFVLESKPQ